MIFSSGSGRGAGSPASVPLLLVLLFTACGKTHSPDAFATLNDTGPIVVAAATDLRSVLPAAELAFDTIGLQPRVVAAVATALNAHPVSRSEVLHYFPPIFRLQGAGALIVFAPPSRLSADEARLLVQVWTEGTERRGATMAAYRVLLVRERDGTWKVHSREPVMVSYLGEAELVPVARDTARRGSGQRCHGICRSRPLRHRSASMSWGQSPAAPSTALPAMASSGITASGSASPSTGTD